MQRMDAVTLMECDVPESGADWEDPWIDLGGEG